MLAYYLWTITKDRHQGSLFKEFDVHRQTRTQTTKTNRFLFQAPCMFGKNEIFTCKRLSVLGTHPLQNFLFVILDIFVTDEPLTSESVTWLGLGFDSDSELTRSTGELACEGFGKLAHSFIALICVLVILINFSYKIWRVFAGVLKFGNMASNEHLPQFLRCYNGLEKSLFVEISILEV